MPKDVTFAPCVSSTPFLDINDVSIVDLEFDVTEAEYVTGIHFVWTVDIIGIPDTLAVIHGFSYPPLNGRFAHVQATWSEDKFGVIVTYHVHFVVPDEK